jgi:hypothetical protein
MPTEIIAILTVLGVFIANAAMIIPLFLWNRQEARSDIRHMDNKLDAIRELTYAIHTEMKDFHNRLVQIEKERK